MALNTCNKCGQEFYGLGCPQCDYPQTELSDAGRRRQRPMGLLLVAIALGILFVFCADGRPTTERWPMLAVAGVFFLGGVSLIATPQGRKADIIGALMCAGFSALGFFAAFGPGTIEGGIPFAPEIWNQALGKVAFGGGAVVCGAMSVCFLYRGIRPRRRGGGGAISATSRKS